MKWDTVIQEKTIQLERYLIGKSKTLDFAEPAPVLERTDNRALRVAILTLTRSEATKRGIGKSTLHYLKNRAQNQRSFAVYSKVSRKLTVSELKP